MAIFDITPRLVNGKYFIENIEQVKESAQEYCKSLHIASVINDAELRLLRNNRTEIRKKIEFLKKTRIDVNDILLGNFNKDMREIEKILKEEDDALKAVKENYEKLILLNTEKTSGLFTIIISDIDEGKIGKIEKYARRLNVQQVERKEKQ